MGRGYSSHLSELISIHALLAESDYFSPRHLHADAHFYPRSPCGERPKSRNHDRRNGIFLSTLSLRRATGISRREFYRRRNFYPRSPCGERHGPGSYARVFGEFLSTLSLRRATPERGRDGKDGGNFYPRSPCGERRCWMWTARPVFSISIHALLAESDRISAWSKPIISKFLSTLSLRRATQEISDHIGDLRDFYPRSPCGERRWGAIPFPLGISISIHALLAESDYKIASTWQRAPGFLSTLSLRRATAADHL